LKFSTRTLVETRISNNAKHVDFQARVQTRGPPLSTLNGSQGAPSASILLYTNVRVFHSFLQRRRLTADAASRLTQLRSPSVTPQASRPSVPATTTTLPQPALHRTASLDSSGSVQQIRQAPSRNGSHDIEEDDHDLPQDDGDETYQYRGNGIVFSDICSHLLTISGSHDNGCDDSIMPSQGSGKHPRPESPSHSPGPIRKAIKLHSSRGRPKASDYEHAAQEILSLAIKIYTSDLSSQNAYPDKMWELTSAKQAWIDACETCEIELGYNSELIKIVSKNGSSYSLLIKQVRLLATLHTSVAKLRQMQGHMSRPSSGLKQVENHPLRNEIAR